MKVYTFGEKKQKSLLMFQCTAEPWWVFERAAKKLSEEFRVFLFISDGHDEMKTDFISIENNVKQAVSFLKDEGIKKLDIVYGVSMGGSSVIYMLAHQFIPVKKAIIDAGITPYSYPKFICRLIALKDFLLVKIAFKSLKFMKLVMPPQRWTPKGEDPEQHYQKIFNFGKNHYSNKTIYNVFWSTNNYSIPNKVLKIDTAIEYWFGEKEAKKRKKDIEYVKKIFPQVIFKEFKGLEHAELVMMFPDYFYEEVMRFWKL